METFVLRVRVAAEPEAASALRGLVDHPRTGRTASVAGGAALAEAIALFLEPRTAEPLAASASVSRIFGGDARQCVL